MGNMRIRELRKKSGLTQMSLAAQMGVTQTIVSDWENEIYLPRAILLPDLARILGCSISDLYTGDIAETEEETP